MKGRILGFDSRTGDGMISSDDGGRYPFSAGDWKQRTPPQTGQIVDLEPLDGQARAVYAVGGGNALAGDKNRIVAALLALFLGGLGIHKFYLGKNTAGIIMLLVSLFGGVLLFVPTLVIGVIAFIEFIIYLVTSDDDFHRKYVEGDQAWF